jgi:hypothetical protein
LAGEKGFLAGSLGTVTRFGERATGLRSKLATSAVSLECNSKFADALKSLAKLEIRSLVIGLSIAAAVLALAGVFGVVAHNFFMQQPHQETSAVGGENESQVGKGAASPSWVGYVVGFGVFGICVLGGIVGLALVHFSKKNGGDKPTPSAFHSETLKCACEIGPSIANVLLQYDPSVEDGLTLSIKEIMHQDGIKEYEFGEWKWPFLRGGSDVFNSVIILLYMRHSMYSKEVDVEEMYLLFQNFTNNHVPYPLDPDEIMHCYVPDGIEHLKVICRVGTEVLEALKQAIDSRTLPERNSSISNNKLKQQ